MAYSISASDNLCYPGSTVLINRLNLQTQEALNKAELAAVSVHAAEIQSAFLNEPFTFDAYCKLHGQLFGDLYEWAGSLRTIGPFKKKERHFIPRPSSPQ